MTRAQAEGASHPGPCDDDVAELVQVPAIRRQLRKISDEDLREELREYGAWSDEELQDRQENELRIVWIAAGDICEECRERDILRRNRRTSGKRGEEYDNDTSGNPRGKAVVAVVNA